MILCSKECIPCCDYCIHVIHDTEIFNGKIIVSAPINCSLYDDNEHKRIASGCGYCDDFHCNNANK